MPASLLKCRGCGATFKLGTSISAGMRLRCKKCGEITTVSDDSSADVEPEAEKPRPAKEAAVEVVEEEPEDRDDRREPRRSRDGEDSGDRRPRKTGRKKRGGGSSVLKPLLITAGVLFFLMLVGGGVVLVVLSRGGPGGGLSVPGLPGLGGGGSRPTGLASGPNAAVTKDNLVKIQAHWPLEKAEAILGKGSEVTLEDLFLLSRGPEVAKFMGRTGALTNPCFIDGVDNGVENWYHWANGKDHIVLGTVPDRSGTPIILFSTFGTPAQFGDASGLGWFPGIAVPMFDEDEGPGGSGNSSNPPRPGAKPKPANSLITRDKVDRIKLNMTRAELISVLGQPTEIFETKQPYFDQQLSWLEKPDYVIALIKEDKAFKIDGRCEKRGFTKARDGTTYFIDKPKVKKKR